MLRHNMYNNGLRGFLDVAVQSRKYRQLFTLAPRLNVMEAWREIATDVSKNFDVRYQAPGLQGAHERVA